MSSLLSKIHESVSHAKHNAHDLAQVTKAFAEEKLLDVKYVDLEIQFIGASGLPKMDAFGLADPYFVASLHSHVDPAQHQNQNEDASSSRISFVSTVQPHTLTPVWNEIWRVRNVPSTTDLVVEILDKDIGAPRDDYIGKFKVSVNPGAKECEIEGPILDLGKVVGLRKDRGSFWLKITSQPSPLPPPISTLPSFLFAGPIRYSIHFSPTVGLLTNLPDARLYCTWKMYLVGVGVWFREEVTDEEQAQIENAEASSSTNANVNDTEKPPPLPPRPNQRPGSPSSVSSLPNPHSPPSSQQHHLAKPKHFRPIHQHWNTQYKAAQSIFGTGPSSFAVRSGIQAGHRMLYARSTRNGFGVLGEGKKAGGNNNDAPTPTPAHDRNEEAKRIGEDLKRLLCGSVNVNPNDTRQAPGLLKAFSTSNNNNANSNSNAAEGESALSTAERESSGIIDPPPSQTQGQSQNSPKSRTSNRIKPTIYTYIISSEDDSFRFSETGAPFFVDFASKHALHANCCERVRYSGEFHPRPRVASGLGWAGFNDDMKDDEVEWELVFDNNSGTYAPNEKHLPLLKGLFEGNFCGGPLFPSDDINSTTTKPDMSKKSPSGLHIITYSQSNPELKKSVEATREYALKYRGVKKEDFEPRVGEGEVTLSYKASTRRPGVGAIGAGGKQKAGEVKEKLGLEGRMKNGLEQVEGYDDEPEEESGEGEGGEEGKGLRDRLRKMGVGRE